MKRRIFTITDQRKFASFSGDFNPIHLDNQKSIKTHAGQPIVHGVHLVLWALDVFKIKIRSNTVIETSFKSQVNLNEEELPAIDPFQGTSASMTTGQNQSMNFF